MNNLNIKIVLGFRDDQQFSIPAEEAHNAYYLFLHPTERGVFKNGLAIRGSDIKNIEPDWNATMGWHPTHQLDSYDWDEIRSKGVDRKMRLLQKQATELAKLPKPPLDRTLSEALYLIPTIEDKPQLGSGMKNIGEIMK